MELVTLASRADHLDDPTSMQVRRLYEESFPDDERLPADEVLVRRERDRSLHLAVESGRVAGLAVTLPHPALRTVLLEYLAVDPAIRSRGTGGALLRHVLDHASPHRVLAEIEPPDAGQPDTVRRAAFYRRHGLSPAPWQRGYGMPSATGDSFLTLELWTTPADDSPDDPAAFMREFYRQTYGDRAAPFLERVVGGVAC